MLMHGALMRRYGDNHVMYVEDLYDSANRKLPATSSIAAACQGRAPVAAPGAAPSTPAVAVQGILCRFVDRRPVAPHALVGGVPLDMVLDTGAQISIHPNWRLPTASLQRGRQPR